MMLPRFSGRGAKKGAYGEEAGRENGGRIFFTRWMDAAAFYCNTVVRLEVDFDVCLLVKAYKRYRI